MSSEVISSDGFAAREDLTDLGEQELMMRATDALVCLSVVMSTSFSEEVEGMYGATRFLLAMRQMGVN